MRTKLRLFIGFFFCVVLILVHMFGGFEQFSIENMRACGDRCLILAHSYHYTSALIYCLSYSCAIIFALPMATVMTLIGGYLFDVPWGSLYAIIGATVGAVCSFIIVRYCLGDVIQEKYKKQLTRLNADIATHGANYLLIMRLMHVFPFFLVNILAALTVIPLSTFTIITIIGLIPSALIFGFVGRQLHLIESVTDVFSLPIIAAFVALSLMAMLPLFIQYVQKRRAMNVAKN